MGDNTKYMQGECQVVECNLMNVLPCACTLQLHTENNQSHPITVHTTHAHMHTINHPQSLPTHRSNSSKSFCALLSLLYTKCTFSRDTGSKNGVTSFHVL